MRFLTEIIAMLFGAGIRHRKAVFVFLFALIYSVIMLGVANKYGKFPVPYPLIFVLIGIIYIMNNWKS